MAARGARLFTEMRCDTCHQPEGTGRGPSLDGIFGSVVALENGQSVQADESYLRESILNPGVKVVAGFQPVMPTFQGQINEEQLLQIIAYLKTLGRQEQHPPAAGLNRGAQPQ
jgi:cytochrome c oxidase subunit 2